MRFALLASLVFLATAACGGSTTTFSDDNGSGGSGASGAASGTGATGAGTSNGTSVGGAGGAPTCDIAPLGNTLCVRGESNGNGEALRAGGKVTFDVYPEGCYSSSCTETIRASCIVTGEAVGELVITEDFCLADTTDPNNGCTDDCGGAGQASCSMAEISEGRWNVTLGDIQLTFDVPSALPVGGLCGGNPE